MEDDLADDSEDEDIEREPLPGENIFSRIRRTAGDGSEGDEDEVEDGTAIIRVRRTGGGQTGTGGDEVDELESMNGDVEGGKSGQVKKIKLVLNSNGAKVKTGKLIVGPDGKPRKRSVVEVLYAVFVFVRIGLRGSSRRTVKGGRAEGGGGVPLPRRGVSKERLGGMRSLP